MSKTVNEQAFEEWKNSQFQVGEEAEPELKFKVMAFCFDVQIFAPENPITERITNLLDDGWQIDHEIIARANVLLVFSREKEIAEDEQAG